MAPFRSNSRRSRRSRSLDRQSDASGGLEWRERDQFIMTFPVHPLPSMQAAFEESMIDSTGETGYVPYLMPSRNIDERQQQLCRDVEASELGWNFTYNCHWRHHPKGKFHPLLKTLTQIVFGIHLLHQQLQKSVGDVADILLKHVMELDSFLQRANEDIEASLKDMLFRRKCLKVPMEHVNEFDRLLDDRGYRAQLLDGNVTIERTINRMSILLNDYLMDVNTFREANVELDRYLTAIAKVWAIEDEDVAKIFGAMCGNTSGWSQVLQNLVAKAEKLGVVLVQVSSYCNEIEKRCGAASRRSLIASRSSSRSTNSRDAARSFHNFADNKPLPMVPNERPPFMASPSGSSSASIDESFSQRHQDISRSFTQGSQMRTVFHSDSEESLQHHSHISQPPSATSTQTSRSDVTVLPQDHHQKPDHSGDSPVDIPTERISLRQVPSQTESSPDQQLESLSSSAPSQPASRSTPGHIDTAKGRGKIQSPPLTGNDSAYSSVSDSSFASRTNAIPRSASAQSLHTPRAQFGLFPSSTPSTPKLPHPVRHDALSPSPMSERPFEAPPPQPARSQSAMTNHSTASSSSRRLLKKSSLSSIKRLFSKKKHAVDTIAE